MSEVLYTLALLACPVGMGLMMWLMMRGKKSDHDGMAPSSNSGANVELTKLRAEVDQLRASQRDSEQNTAAAPTAEAGSR
jgi:flagellar basal body rod protein FlgF